MTAIPEREVLRYLGNARADDALVALMRSVSAELLREVRPSGVSRRLEISVAGGAIDAGGFRFASKDLARNLAGCKEAFFTAATLGPAADRLLRKYAALDMPRAAVLQASCAALIEQYLDGVVGELAASVPGRFLRPRFSPGYGDFDIRSQKSMFALLDLSRRLGLSLTEGFMMLPEKSVTAIIGISDIEHNIKAGCAACARDDCAQRREPHEETAR